LPSLASALGDAPTLPAFCDTHFDQVVALSDLGPPQPPKRPFAAVDVVYADGSPGTIEITPVKSSDVYSVPPGAMVAYRPPSSIVNGKISDDALQVAWQVNGSFKLLTMAEADYYQLRLSIKDATGFDKKGVHISLGVDSDPMPGFLEFVQPTAPTCAGASQPVSDYTVASVLLANALNASGESTPQYVVELSGKSTSTDNSAGDHDGFLCATLAFKTSGADKYPSRTVRIPMLCPVNLPIAIQPPVRIVGADTVPTGYVNAAYTGTIGAAGGVQPYVWAQVSPPPAGLQWVASSDGLQYTISGSLTQLSAGKSYQCTVSVQSDPLSVVSRPVNAPVTLVVTNPPAGPASYANWPWIAGGSVAAGFIVALISYKCYSSKNEEKVDSEKEPLMRGAVNNQNSKNLAKTSGDPLIISANSLNKSISVSPATDKKTAGIVSQLLETQRTLKLKEYFAADLAFKQAEESKDVEEQERLLDLMEKTDADINAIDAAVQDLDRQEKAADNAADKDD
jgi:hypothetical protein